MAVIRLSHITSYLICPRLCYYRIHFVDESFTEINAVREIYISIRRGFDVQWAENRAKSLYNKFDYNVFNSARRKFVYNSLLQKLNSKDWDVVLKSERLGVVMTVDEIVMDGDSEIPLFVSLKPPENGVWFKDVIKAGLAGIIAGYRKAKVYYAYSGDIRDVKINYSVKRKVVKLIERVRMVKNGYLPERREGKYCNYCSFSEECKLQPETFSSKFL